MEPSSSSSTSSSARSGVPEARRHYPKLSSEKQRRLRRDGVVAKFGSTSSVQPNCRSLALETVGRESTELKAVTSPTEDLTQHAPDTAYQSLERWRTIEGGERTPSASGGGGEDFFKIGEGEGPDLVPSTWPYNRSACKNKPIFVGILLIRPPIKTDFRR
jgi:hypothetical protein